MPTYDYRCLNCRRRFDVFMSYSEYGKTAVHCPHCQSTQVQRRVSRVRFLRGDDSRFEDLGDPSQLDGLENDPYAMGRMMKKMSSELGEDMGPEFKEVVDRLEKGQSPDEIEKALPDLGGDDSGGLSDDF
jgi:putative FmdB family regulatory protein